MYRDMHYKLPNAHVQNAGDGASPIDMARLASLIGSASVLDFDWNSFYLRSFSSLQCSTLKRSCAPGDTICLRPPTPRKLTISSHLFARWHLFQHVGYLRHQQQVDLWSFDLESGIRVTCEVGYLCANFSIPRPLCSRVRPDVRDRQTDVRQTSDKSVA